MLFLKVHFRLVQHRSVHYRSAWGKGKVRSAKAGRRKGNSLTQQLAPFPGTRSRKSRFAGRVARCKCLEKFPEALFPQEQCPAERSQLAPFRMERSRMCRFADHGEQCKCQERSLAEQYREEQFQTARYQAVACRPERCRRV